MATTTEIWPAAEPAAPEPTKRTDPARQGWLLYDSANGPARQQTARKLPKKVRNRIKKMKRTLAGRQGLTVDTIIRLGSSK